MKELLSMWIMLIAARLMLLSQKIHPDPSRIFLEKCAENLTKKMMEKEK